jgi:hypothetical protein
MEISIGQDRPTICVIRTLVRGLLGQLNGFVDPSAFNGEKCQIGFGAAS